MVSGKSTGNWSAAALFAVSVAVGVVPEMLPAIVNANLARGAFALSKKKAIVKRLDVIQSLGGMSVLCSDKVSTPKIEGCSRHLLMDADWDVDQRRDCLAPSSRLLWRKG